MKAKVNKLSAQIYRFGILALAGILIFAGVMSLVSGDPVVRYSTASVIVLFVIKELF